MYIFGGWNGFSKKWFNDLFEFDFRNYLYFKNKYLLFVENKEWKQIVTNGDIPLPRTSHSAVIYNNCMYVFGGYSGEIYLNDFYEYNFLTNTWKNITHEVKNVLFFFFDFI